MFRKAVLLGLLSLYLITTSGFVLNLHYCGAKLAALQVNAKEAKSCCSTQAEEKNKCCRNTELKIKLSEQQQFSESQKVPNCSSIQLFEHQSIPTNLGWNYSMQDKSPIQLHDPPPLRQPLHVKNCVFRI